MEFPQENRGRSLSTENKNRSLNPSPSHQPPYYDNQPPPAGLDHAGSVFPHSRVLTSSTEQFPIITPYLASSAHDTHFLHSSGAPSSEPQPFGQPQPYSQSFEAGFLSQLERSSNIKAAEGEENFSNLLNSNQQFEDFPIFTNTNPTSDFDSSFMLDPQLNQHHHQQQPQPQQQLNQSVNPADLSRMSSPHNPTPPHLVPPDAHRSPGRPSSPASSPGAYYTPGHSRPASLDPASAAFLTSQPQSDWHGMLGSPAFQTHRRAPSEHSDVSSAAHSPYLSHHDAFDGDTNNHSPLLSAQNDPGLYENALGMETFTISDQRHGLSPGHSPYISPRLLPQQQQSPEPGQDGSFLLTQHVNNQLGPTSPPDLYTSRSEASPAPAFQSHNSPAGDMGQAAQMTPPSINVEFAPPSRTTSFGPAKPESDMDTLSPPVGRSRGRSKSDPFAHAMTRPLPSSTTPLAGGARASSRSLSPFCGSTGNLSTPASRDTSPAAAKNRRQSTSSIDNRNYILDLADPQRPGASSTDSKRVQKHPATFQCSLCPKRFTRAYNLRSHLRTHTDERPFVCTVCGKAFARQHDRKRHESLHSGEKKFVCRGDLARGGHWGCGRRFARADALGRHFRSEAGRVCIKPLLDEEALERERNYVDQQQMHGHLQPVTQQMNIPLMDGQPTGFTLPAALLAQYPALQTLQWDQLASQQDDTSDIGGGGGGGGGRSSYDASSGGEYGFGDDDDSGINSGYVSGSGQNYSPGPPSQDQMMGVPPGGGSWG